MVDLKKITGFDWDQGNIDKSYRKHGVTPREAEESFLDKNVFFQEDIKHSEKEVRFIAICKTTENKMLFSIFTTRKDKLNKAFLRIRIISTRIANIKERRLYISQAKAS